MKKSIAMKSTIFLILLIIALAGLFCAGRLWKTKAEHDVEHYLSSLSMDGLIKIGIYGLGEQVELYTTEEQEEILTHLSKIKASMGGEDADTQALGAIIFTIRLFYADGREEIVNLPAFTYPTLLGDRDFYLSIDGEKPTEAAKMWAPFVKYFKLLQN